ncbi:MAG: Gfo/Idh/MocA family oxidoreductase [Clostridia bacterium]|nr:Gfo/Idh/MocA family oxidoreductase [Clostridia bacterium]MBQ7047163.1 Gfo/Idh/MocA family oxidoreductase [Oscillospiraceae bacterium]
MDKSKKIGFAVIGYGGMGSWHASQMEKFEDTAELIGIYDINPERCALAEERGIHAFSSREELLADERIDLVTVATPNDVHKEIAVAAMAVGKNVISEKPVAMNPQELEEMIAASEKYGKLFTVHQNRRWDPDYKCIRKIIDDNSLGKVFRIESRVQGSRGIPGDWRNKKKHGGGMVLDWGIHLLDQALQIGEGRKLISVYTELTNVTNEECDDGFRTTLIFEGDLSYYVEVTTSNFIELPRWYILGENGSAVVTDWDVNGEIVKVSDWENRDAVPILAGVGLTKTMAPRTDDTIKRYELPKVESRWTQFYENVLAAIRGEEEQIVTHDQQRRLMKLVDAIFESGYNNKVVFFDE